MNTKLVMGVLATAMIVSAQGPPPGPPGGFGAGPMGRGPGGPGGRGFGGPGGMGPQAKVAGAPYSAVQTTDSVQTLADGSRITHSESTKVFRDSQGRVRTETTMTTPSGSTAQAHTMINIFDPVEGSMSRIDTARLTVDKNMVPANMGARRGPPPADGSASPRAVGPRAEAGTVDKADLGSRTINGVLATGTRTTRTIPAGTMGNSAAIQSVHEVWLSQDLQVPVLITDTDPRMGTRTTQLTNILRSEPDGSLFVAPSGYTVNTHTRGGGPPR